MTENLRYTQYTSTATQNQAGLLNRNAIEHVASMVQQRHKDQDNSFLSLTEENLRKVKNKAFCVIEVPLFSKQVCEQILGELSRVTWQKYRQVNEIPLLGANLWDHYHDQQAYVQNSRKYDELLKDQAPSHDAAKTIIKSLLTQANCADVGPVFLEEYQAYGFTGTGKHMVYLNPHTDYVVRDAPDDWHFPNIKSQIAMNLILSDVPEDAGGECVVFNKMYEPGDDEYQLPPPSTFGYSAELFSDSQFKVLRPVQGSIFIFSSEYYHCVLPCDTDRYTLSFFMGELEDGRLAMWA